MGEPNGDKSAAAAFQRARAERDNFPPLEDALAPPQSRALRRRRRQSRSSESGAAAEDDSDAGPASNWDDDNEDDDGEHPDGQVNWSIEQLAVLFPAEIEDPPSDLEDWVEPTPKRLRNYPGSEDGDVADLSSKPDAPEVFAALGATLTSPLPSSQPPAAPAEPAWSPIPRGPPRTTSPPSTASPASATVTPVLRRRWVTPASSILGSSSPPRWSNASTPFAPSGGLGSSTALTPALVGVLVASELDWSPIPGRATSSSDPAASSPLLPPPPPP